MAEAITRLVAGATSFSPALETDEARPLGRRKVRALGVALETGASQGLLATKRRQFAPALEVGSALALTRSHRLALGVATEASGALSMSRTKRRALAAALESDEARPLGSGLASPGLAKISLDVATGRSALAFASRRERLAAGTGWSTVTGGE